MFGGDAKEFKDYTLLANNQPQNRFVAEIPNKIPDAIPVFESFLGGLKSKLRVVDNLTLN